MNNHTPYLDMCLSIAGMSPDPATKVGAVIVDTLGDVVSTGFNSFPRRVQHTVDRLHDREEKLPLMIHAEVKAIISAARRGVSTNGCRLYLAATDDTGMIWGGPPCVSCSIQIIQAGIFQIVSPPIKPTPSKWHEDLKRAETLLAEAGVSWIGCGEMP
jgi:dCMP deaminase